MNQPFEIRIATLNVHCGANGTYSRNPAHVGPAPEYFAELVDAVDATPDVDIFVLTDTFYWTTYFNEDYLRDAFGMQRVVMIDTNDVPLKRQRLAHTNPNIGITVLSRVEFTSAEIVRCLNRQFIRINFADGREKLLQLFAVYADHALEKTRVGQVAAAVAIANQHPKLATAIVGDYNSPPKLSLKLRIYLLATILNTPPVVFYRHYYVNRLRHMAFPRVVPYLEKAGFRGGESVPGTFEVLGSPVALDNVMARGAVVSDVHVSDLELPFTDHRMLLATVTVTPSS